MKKWTYKEEIIAACTQNWSVSFRRKQQIEENSGNRRSREAKNKKKCLMEELSV